MTTRNALITRMTLITFTDSLDSMNATYALIVTAQDIMLLAKDLFVVFQEFGDYYLPENITTQLNNDVLTAMLDEEGSGRTLIHIVRAHPPPSHPHLSLALDSCFGYYSHNIHTYYKRNLTVI